MANPDLLTYYDNVADGSEKDFSVANPDGQIRYSFPIKQQPGHAVLKQRFCQYHDSYVKLAVGSAGPVYATQATYLVDETELEDSGVGKLVFWDRVWATIPGAWSEATSFTKSFQAGQYQFSGASLIDLGIVAWSGTVRGDAFHSYFRGAATSNLAGPALTLISFATGGPGGGPLKVLTDNGTGFPRGIINGINLFTSNQAYAYTSGSIRPYLGDILEAILFYGGT